MGAACNSTQVGMRIRKSCTPFDRNIRNPSRVGTPEVNVDVFSPSCGSNSSFIKWSRNMVLLDTSVDVYATQENNSDFSCIGKVGVKVSPIKLSLIFTRAYG